MKFGRGIVGAATVAVASAATHGVHHPNQRQFHERPGYGAQANFDAGDAFGVNANVNLGNPLAGNQFFMPIIVGLGVLSVLNIATDVLGLAFGDDKEDKGNGTDDDDNDGNDDVDAALNITRQYIDFINMALDSKGTGNVLKILEWYADDKNLDKVFNNDLVNWQGLADAIMSIANSEIANSEIANSINQGISQLNLQEIKEMFTELLQNHFPNTPGATVPGAQDYVDQDSK